MSENLQHSLTEKLNEETWTRATISNYTIEDFKSLDEIIMSARKEKCIDDIFQQCNEHLTKSKNSIIALYISSIISLQNQDVDDSNLKTLVDIFSDNKRTVIVEHLCNRALEYGESKYALRTLANSYKSDGNDQVYEIWERIVKIDFEDAEIPNLLAEKYESDGDIERAIDFYKKALSRYTNKKQNSGVKETWTTHLSRSSRSSHPSRNHTPSTT